MMKEYQFTDTCSPSSTGCHLNGAVTIAMFRLFVILGRILCIVNKQISPFGKGQEIRVASLAPLHIGSVDQASPRIVDTIKNGSVQRVAMCKLNVYTYISLFCICRIGDDSRFAVIITDDVLIFRYRMKGALRRQCTYIHWKIRWRHERGYKFLDIPSFQGRAKKINGGAT